MKSLHLLLTCLLLSSTASLLAQTRTWTDLGADIDATTGNWSTLANWGGGDAPDTATEIANFDGVSPGTPGAPATSPTPGVAWTTEMQHTGTTTIDGIVFDDADGDGQGSFGYFFGSANQSFNAVSVDGDDFLIEDGTNDNIASGTFNIGATGLDVTPEAYNGGFQDRHTANRELQNVRINQNFNLTQNQVWTIDDPNFPTLNEVDFNGDGIVNTADETVLGMDLNGDGDHLDTAVSEGLNGDADHNDSFERQYTVEIEIVGRVEDTGGTTTKWTKDGGAILKLTGDDANTYSGVFEQDGGVTRLSKSDNRGGNGGGALNGDVFISRGTLANADDTGAATGPTGSEQIVDTATVVFGNDGRTATWNFNNNTETIRHFGGGNDNDTLDFGNGGFANSNLNFGAGTTEDMAFDGRIRRDGSINFNGTGMFTMTGTDQDSGTTHVDININTAGAIFQYAANHTDNDGDSAQGGRSFIRMANGTQLFGTGTAAEHIEIQAGAEFHPGRTRALTESGIGVMGQLGRASGDSIGNNVNAGVQDINQSEDGRALVDAEVGTMRVGDLTILAGGTMHLDIASGAGLGSVNGVTHDHVDIEAIEGLATGTLNLITGAKIEVNLLGGAASVKPGDQWDFLDWETIIPGGFETGVGIGLTTNLPLGLYTGIPGTDFFGATRFNPNQSRPGGVNPPTVDLILPAITFGRWDVSDFLSHGILRIVPEPSRAMLLMLGALAIITRRRR